MIKRLSTTNPYQYFLVMHHSSSPATAWHSIGLEVGHFWPSLGYGHWRVSKLGHSLSFSSMHIRSMVTPTFPSCCESPSTPCRCLWMGRTYRRFTFLGHAITAFPTRQLSFIEIICATRLPAFLSLHLYTRPVDLAAIKHPLCGNIHLQ